MAERIELDFLRPEPRVRWASVALLAIALALAGDLARTYRALDAEATAKEVLVARKGNVTVAARPAPLLVASPEEYASARDTVRRLSTPWGRLFQALESAQGDRIALLAIEPDADAGTVSLSGEAKDYLAVLSYVATLEERKELGRVHLARHEIKTSARERPVSFTITAAWQERR